MIVAPPTIIHGETTQTVNVYEGRDVNLTCDATGYPAPNISWVRVNGETLPPPYNRYAVKVFIFSAFVQCQRHSPINRFELLNCCFFH